MRWHKPKPESGDIKVVKHFAFLPRRVGNDIIWLQSYFAELHFHRYDWESWGSWLIYDEFLTDE